MIIIFAGKILQPCKSLLDLHVGKESTFHWIHKLTATNALYLGRWVGVDVGVDDMKFMMVDKFELVEKVKFRIQDLMGVPVEDQELLYEGEIVDDQEWLFDYAHAFKYNITLRIKEGSSAPANLTIPVLDEI